MNKTEQKEHAQLNEMTPQQDLSDLSLFDYTESNVETAQKFEDNLQMKQWMTEPEAKKSWDDINKDMTTGNLAKSEIESITMYEQANTALIAIRNGLPQTVANILFPFHLVEINRRKIAQICALSLSKSGFLRIIEASKIIRKDISFGQENDFNRGEFTPKEKELDWNEAVPLPFFNRKRPPRRRSFF